MPDSVSLKVETNQPAVMRDGTTLYADVYRPDGPGPFPTILQRTPYDKTAALSSQMMDPMKTAKAGFALVIQDTRGRYTSGGEFYCFVDDINDGYDSVEWAASQPWSTGKVGMVGTSYVGATQWLAAISRPPHLAAIAPNVTASNYHDGWTYQGGAFELGFNMSWTLLQLTLANFKTHSGAKSIPQARQAEVLKAVDGMTESFKHLPLKDYPHLNGGLADYYFDWLEHPTFDDYWKKLCIEEQHANINVPAMNIGGWYDIFLGGTIRNFMGMQKHGATEDSRRGQRLIIGPWQHGSRGGSMAGSHYFGVAADAMALGLDEIHLRWFSQWLKGEDTGLLDEPPVKIFVMGDDVWRDENEWPLARALEHQVLPAQRRQRQLAAWGRQPAAPRRRRTRRPTCSCTTRPTPCRPGAGSCAATPTSPPTGPTTRTRSRLGPTCWSTQRRCWNATWRSPDR